MEAGFERVENTTAVPPPPAAGRARRPRHLHFAGFLAATAWYFCATVLAASAADGLGYRIGLGPWQPVLRGLFEVFLIALGVMLLAGVERRKTPLRLLLGLPLRKTARKEWAEGAAVGWAIAVFSVVAMLPTGAPSVQLWTGWRAWEMALLNLVAMGLLSLGFAIGLFGYGYHRLIDGIGPTRATVIMCLAGGVYGLAGMGFAGSSGGRVLMSVLATLVLCVCWLRTHGVWLLWGLAFAWAAALGVLFGMPLAGSSTFGSVVDMRSSGPVWLTGGEFGPADALPTVILLLAAIPLVMKLTSDYAWDYTHPPIVAGGYPVDVAPPRAHDEMERGAAVAPTVPVLVQILPSTPQGRTPEPQ